MSKLGFSKEGRANYLQSVNDACNLCLTAIDEMMANNDVLPEEKLETIKKNVTQCRYRKLLLMKEYYDFMIEGVDYSKLLNP